MFLQSLFRKHARQQNSSNLRTLRGGVTLKKRFAKTMVGLGLVCGVHTAAMHEFEDLSWGDSAWLTTTTATTVGYGDLSAQTPEGRLSTFFLMYALGITLLANGAGLFVDMRNEKREKLSNGKWKWKMDDHMVILNAPKNNPERYLSRMMTELRASALPKAQKPALVVTQHFKNGMPKELSNLRIAHVNNDVYDEEGYENSNLDEAGIVVILSQDENDPASDSITLDLISRAREENPNARIIAEAVEEKNRKRFEKMGADQVIRPIRSYPELLVRAILSPGSEEVIENLFNAEGEETIRYDIYTQGKWGDIASALITEDIGLPLAYLDKNGEAILNQDPNKEVDITGVIALAREGNVKEQTFTAKALSKELSKNSDDAVSVIPAMAAAAEQNNNDDEDKNHIVILNTPENRSEEYLTKMVGELRRSCIEKGEKPVSVVTSGLENGLPQALKDMKVSHVAHDATDTEAFEAAKLKDADIIIVLSEDSNDPSSDSKTFDLVAQAREDNPSATIIAESVDDKNSARIEKVGADHVIRAIRSYPEMMVRTILSPGTETVAENLFDTSGEETVTYNMELSGTWKDIATQLIASDIGLPLAYISKDGKAISNEDPQAEIEATGVIVLAREGNIKKTDAVTKAMSARKKQAPKKPAAAQALKKTA